MPRDYAAPSDVVEITLPAGRRGRLCSADDAGQFRVQVNATWIGELQSVGWLSPAEADAASLVVQAFEETGLRQRLASKYDGIFVDHSAGADTSLELMTADQTRSWRRMHRLLNLIPAAHRHQVETVALWGQVPWDVRALRAGLAALAAALRRPRR